MQRLFLIGFMGAGKTTLGRFYASKYNLSFIDLDHFIEERYFKTINQLFSDFGEDGFRKMEQKALHEVSELEDVVIATGGGTPCFFDNMDFMSSKGLTIFLNVPQDELLNRLEKAKGKRPLLKDKSKEEIRAFIKQSLEQRLPYYMQANYAIDGSPMYCKKDLDLLSESVYQFKEQSI